MKRMWWIAPAVFTLASCCAPQKVVWDALDTNWDLIRPYAIAGISKDESITAESKEIRLRNVLEFTRLIDEGVKNAR